MRRKPILEVTLRKYEPPSGDLTENVRFLLLSLGLKRPGEESNALDIIFTELLKSPEGVSVKELAKKAGVSESAVRYHISRLKSLKLVEGSRKYRIAEGDLEMAFILFRKYLLGEILDRIAEYVKKITEQLSQEL